MIQIWRNVFGVFIGFITVVAASIVLSLFSLVIFSELLTEKSPLDVLVTAVWPLTYSLFALFISIVAGVFVASHLSKRSSITIALAVAVVYGLYAYLLSQSPSNLVKPYPDWFVISSYVVLLPAAFIGHLIAKKVVRNS